MGKWTLPTNIWRFLPQNIIYSKELSIIQFSNGCFCLLFKQLENKKKEYLNYLECLDINQNDKITNKESFKLPIIEFSFNYSIKKIISKKNNNSQIYFWTSNDLLIEYSLTSKKVSQIISLKNIIKEFNPNYIKLKIKDVDINTSRQEIVVGDSEGNILIFNKSNTNKKR